MERLHAIDHPATGRDGMNDGHYPNILHDDLLYHCSQYVNAPRANIHVHPERAGDIDNLAQAVYAAAARVADAVACSSGSRRCGCACNFCMARTSA